MARSLWSGSLSFGLVNVPVAMVTAVRDVDLHFRQLHQKDGAPIQVQRWCSEEDVEVSYEEITHAYELEDGGQVIVTDEEAKDVEAATQKSHKPSAAQLKAAVAVIEELSGDWEPGEWKDRYRRRLQDVVSRKRKGKTIKAPEPRETAPEEMPDLMAALEQTLAEIKDGKRPVPA